MVRQKLQASILIFCSFFACPPNSLAVLLNSKHKENELMHVEKMKHHANMSLIHRYSVDQAREQGELENALAEDQKSTLHVQAYEANLKAKKAYKKLQSVPFYELKSKKEIQDEVKDLAQKANRDSLEASEMEKTKTSPSTSNLNWGHLFETPASSKAVDRYQSGLLDKVKLIQNTEFKAAEEILTEGKLPSDLGVAESEKHTKQIPNILKLAVCARIARDPKLKITCSRSATQGLLEWANVYKTSGNPINESKIVPLILAWDILMPQLKKEDQQILKNFGLKIIGAGDLFFKQFKMDDERLHNNWGTWRLTIRSLCASVLNEPRLIQESKELFNKHVVNNISENGKTLDFGLRDALHYQVYDLEAYLEALTWIKPGFFSGESTDRIRKGFEFLRPFYTGEVRHIEFKNSKVAFDKIRKDAGLSEYQNKNWEPKSARRLLRLARVSVPQIRSWTQDVVDESYDPLLKLQVASRDEE